MGVAATLALFIGLVWRSFWIAQLASRANLKFQAYLAAGFGIWLGCQALINIGVNMGVLPTKGLTLPLMSYGRSSMIVTLAWVGLLLRVYHEAMQSSRGMATVRRSKGAAPTTHAAARRGASGMSEPRPILIMAGGTGGHVFPALALARLLRAASHEVVWLGTRRGLEARVVPAENIAIEWLSMSGLRGKGVVTLLAAPFKLLRSIWQALRRDAPAPARAGGGFRRIRDRPRRRRRLAHAPPADDPRAERHRGLFEPRARASGARRAGGISASLSRRRRRARGRQSGARRDRHAAAAGDAFRAPRRRAAPAGRGRQSGRGAAQHRGAVRHRTVGPATARAPPGGRARHRRGARRLRGSRRRPPTSRPSSTTWRRPTRMRTW